MNIQPTKYKIALVDDEESILQNIKYKLVKEGYCCQTYLNGQTAWSAFQMEMPDLIVLDVMMPQIDGIELCRMIRTVDKRVPIIFLSSRDEEIDRILGLEMGGDDYICKPFSLRELMVRIKVLFRRIEMDGLAEDVLNWGKLSMDIQSCRVRWDDQILPLTVTEFRMLESLVRYPGVVKSRGQLMAAAFPDDNFVSDRAADSHIKRLRKKINLQTGDQNIIETVYGLGYRLREI